MVKFSELCVERPLGSSGNNEVIKSLTSGFSELNYTSIELPMECTVWNSDHSYIRQNDTMLKINPGPFSLDLSGNFPAKSLSNVSELRSVNRFSGILIFKDDLAKETIMPKNYPFYFPDEHRDIYDLIETIQPRGIIAITGKDTSSGMNPFPLFEDANMLIPTAFVQNINRIDCSKEISITINSGRKKAKSKQLIFRKEGTEKEIILVCAHMDSKYFTNAALDNASGVYTLYETARLIDNNTYTIEIVPFNGEESPEAAGELAYLQYLSDNNYTVKTVINIDSPGHIGSENAFSFYNFDENKKKQLTAENRINEGTQWYSGDHAMFMFREIPCIAITSSDMFEDSINLTHTEKDTPGKIDINLLTQLSKTIAKIINNLRQ